MYRSVLIENIEQVHGFPDISIGWRYQIPMLLDMGFQVIAPDLMGFGQTVCVFSSMPVLCNVYAS